MANHRHIVTHRPRRNTIWPGAIALALIMGTLVACSNEPLPPVADTQRTQTGEANPNSNQVTVDQVNNNLGSLVGKMVTVKSAVELTNDPNSFRLADDELFGERDVLVFNATGQPILLPKDGETPVQVTGEVRQFIKADVERQYGISLDPETFADYERRPVIFAESVALSPDADELTENPQQFYNQTVAVTGEVHQVSNPNTFTLVDEDLFGGNDLLVLHATPQQAIADGATVTVVGELRPFVVADIDRDYQLTWDLELQRRLETEFKDKPVLVARQVYSDQTHPQ